MLYQKGFVYLDVLFSIVLLSISGFAILNFQTQSLRQYQAIAHYQIAESWVLSSVEAVRWSEPGCVTSLDNMPINNLAHKIDKLPEGLGRWYDDGSFCVVEASWDEFIYDINLDKWVVLRQSYVLLR